MKIRRVEPAWRYRAEGIIWRLLPVAGGHFVGEERDIATKSVSFFCIERQNGSVLWSGIKCEGGWWSGIESVSGSAVLLHGYATPDMPDHKKIYALDLLSGKSIWSSEDLKFLFAGGGRIYASLELNRSSVLREINPADGAVVREIGQDQIDSLKDNLAPVEGEDAGFPSVYSPQGADALTKGALESATRGYEGIRFAEYIVMSGLIVVGFYKAGRGAVSENNLEQHMAVIHKKTGRVLYRDLVNESVSSAVPDTFFAVENSVYYIKDKKTLTAMNF